MIIEQFVEASSKAVAVKELEYAERLWAYNRANSNEFKAKLQKLQGSLSKSAFDGLDGLAYQRNAREGWDRQA